MNELSPQQMRILETLVARAFIPVAFPMYANAVGIRKGSCAALLDPVPNGGFRIYGEASVLLDGNLTVRITDQARSWFVWKKQRVEATPELTLQLAEFVAELQTFLESQA